MRLPKLLWAAWAAVLLLAVLVYGPGTEGGFLLDDINNLRGLSEIRDDSLAGSMPYLLQGASGPGGRPLSLLTFALQREHWPDSPQAFKLTNVALHALNACLLLILVLLSMNAGQRRDSALRWVPLVAATIWLLWPIHLSTVLYVVQRMAMLAAGCMLTGLILYSLACRAWERGRVLAAHLLFAAGLGTGLGVGVLFKESAAVFPLLVLVLESWRRHGSGRPPCPRAWIVVWIAIVLGLVVYLFGVRDVLGGYASRPFDLEQRLLTEARVLWLYVQRIVAPSPAALQFHYDDLIVSSSLLSPPTTLLAVVSWTGIAAAALALRKRYALASSVSLFFLAAHVLESSVLPLELAFEHRNYLASASLAVGLATAWLVLVREARGVIRRGFLAVSGVGYLVAITGLTYAQSQLWGDPQQLAASRFRHHPESERATGAYAEELRKAGATGLAARVLDGAVQRFPEDPFFPVARAELTCSGVAPPETGLAEAQEALRGGASNLLSTYAVLDRFALRVEHGACPAITAEDLLRLTGAALDNPAMGPYKTDLLLIAGRLHAAAGEQRAARRMLERAIGRHPRPRLIVQAAAWELAQGQRERAGRYVEMLGPDGPLSVMERWSIDSDRQRLELWMQELAEPTGQ